MPERARGLAKSRKGARQRRTKVDAVIQSVGALGSRSQRPVHIVGAGGTLVHAFREVDHVAGSPRRVDQGLIGFGAGPRRPAGIEAAAAVAIGEADVVRDGLGRAACKEVDDHRVHQSRPRPPADHRFEATQADLVDLDD